MVENITKFFHSCLTWLSGVVRECFLVQAGVNMTKTTPPKELLVHLEQNKGERASTFIQPDYWNSQQVFAKPVMALTPD